MAFKCVGAEVLRVTKGTGADQAWPASGIRGPADTADTG